MKWTGPEGRKLPPSKHDQEVERMIQGSGKVDWVKAIAFGLIVLVAVLTLVLICGTLAFITITAKQAGVVP